MKNSLAVIIIQVIGLYSAQALSQPPAVFSAQCGIQIADKCLDENDADSFQSPSLVLDRTEIFRAYWHWKLNSIRLSSSIKQRIYTFVIYPLIAPVSAYFMRDYRWPAQVAVALVVPNLFNLVFDQALRMWDASFEHPENSVSGMTEDITHAAEIIDGLHADLDKRIDLAFASNKK